MSKEKKSLLKKRNQQQRWKEWPLRDNEAQRREKLEKNH